MAKIEQLCAGTQKFVCQNE